MKLGHQGHQGSRAPQGSLGRLASKAGQADLADRGHGAQLGCSVHQASQRPGSMCIPTYPRAQRACMCACAARVLAWQPLYLIQIKAPNLPKPVGCSPLSRTAQGPDSAGGWSMGPLPWAHG